MVDKLREGEAGDTSPSYTTTSTTNSTTNSTTSTTLGLRGEEAQTQPFSMLAAGEMVTPPVAVRGRAVSEVRVDVDYGATTSILAREGGEGMGEDVRLGNEVVIGSGSRPGTGMGMELGRHWGRSSPWG
jgi:hypothetical protein